MEYSRIQSIGEDLIRVLEAKNAARERALSNRRTTIRHCAHSIRAYHRGERDAARSLLTQAGDLVEATRTDILSTHPDIYWAGYVQDAQRE